MLVGSFSSQKSGFDSFSVSWNVSYSHPVEITFLFGFLEHKSLLGSFSRSLVYFARFCRLCNHTLVSSFSNIRIIQFFLTIRKKNCFWITMSVASGSFAGTVLYRRCDLFDYLQWRGIKNSPNRFPFIRLCGHFQSFIEDSLLHVLTWSKRGSKNQ